MWQKTRAGLVKFVCVLALLALVPAIAPSQGQPNPPATAQDDTAGAPATVQEIHEATEKVAEQVAEKAAEKAAAKAVEQTTDRVVDQAVEKAVEKAAEKAAEEQATKEEITSERPDEWYGPTTVRFMIFIIDVDEIDDAAQNFTTNVYLRMRWEDRRLASPGTLPRQLPLANVWNPRVLLANQQGLLPKSLPDVVQVDSHGGVTYHQRYSGKLSQPLLLSNFPMDTNMFTVQFVAAGYAANELTFVPDVGERADLRIEGGTIADRLSLPDWKILSHRADVTPYSPVAGMNTAGFTFQFEARRYIAYYLWQVVMPLAVIVVMSWSAFWIDTKSVGVRIGVATSSILTLIAHRFVLASLLPRLPYMTRMDYLTVGSTLLVLIALVAVLWTSQMDTRQETAKAERVDRWARAVFPIMFLLLFGWFVSGAWLLV